MNTKYLLPGLAVGAACVAAAGAWLAPTLRPVPIGGNDPQIQSLREAVAGLATYTPGLVSAEEARLEAYRRSTWNDQRLGAWVEGTVRRAGWTWRDLGPADLKHVKAHRYALQKPQASAADWPEIKKMLGEVEGMRDVSVESVRILAGSGVAASRRFEQCLFILVVYGAGDDAS